MYLTWKTGTGLKLKTEGQSRGANQGQALSQDYLHAVMDFVGRYKKNNQL